MPGTGLLHFKVVTPEEQLHQENVSQVVLPGANGLIGILPRHAPVVLLLEAGIIDIYHGKKVSERIFIGGGFAYIDEENCTVMADEGIRVSDLREEEVQAHIDRVHAEIKEAREEDEHEMLQKTLMIARAKLDLIEVLRSSGKTL